MTHSFLHFSIGYLSGTIAMLISFMLKPPARQPSWPSLNIIQKISLKRLSLILLGTDCRPSIRAFAWILTSIALGTWGLVPKLIFRLTGFNSNGLWINIFCGYGIINRLRPGGGMVVGGIVILLSVSLQYSLILWLISRKKG